MDTNINREAEILEIINANDDGQLSKLIVEHHPYDIARVFEELDYEQRQKVYSALSPEQIAPVFEHLNRTEIPRYFLEQDPTYNVKILEYMDIDETVDILRNFKDEELRLEYISLLNATLAKEIKALLKYDDEVVGSIMNTSFIIFDDEMIVSDAMKHLLKEAKSVAFINILYVVDKSLQLVGVLSLRRLIVADKKDEIKDIMTDKVISVQVTESKESAATKFKDYDFEAIPVVDSHNRMIGIVTVDDIIDFIEDEATEDYAKLAGIFDGEIDHTKDRAIDSVKKRIPWLVILIFIGMLSAFIVGQFEETLSALPILTMFLPMVLDSAGNVGTQSLAVTIQYLTDDDFLSKQNIKKHIRRETLVGLVNGLIVGILTALISFVVLSIMNPSTNVFDASFVTTGAIIGLSMFSSIFVSNISGAIVPLIVNSFKIDPAAASGPFITTINDIIALTIYFGLASYFLL